jgi:hypothetical protein
MFDSKAKSGLSIGDYMLAVKVARKKIDGCETYGGWTPYIKRCHGNGMPVDVCAVSVARRAKELHQ